MSDDVTPRRTFNLQQMMLAIAGVGVFLGVVAWADRCGLWWEASQAIEIGLYFYPIFAGVAGVAMVVAVGVAIRDRRVRRFRSLWMLFPFLVPMALLAFGIAFRHSQGDGVAASALDQRRLIVEWFDWLHAPVGLVLLGCFRSVSNWVIIGCITLASVWLSFGAGIMSWMRVTDVWL